jgi:hypothetical protein
MNLSPAAPRALLRTLQRVVATWSAVSTAPCSCRDGPGRKRSCCPPSSTSLRALPGQEGRLAPAVKQSIRSHGWLAAARASPGYCCSRVVQLVCVLLWKLSWLIWVGATDASELLKEPCGVLRPSRLSAVHNVGQLIIIIVFSSPATLANLVDARVLQILLTCYYYSVDCVYAAGSRDCKQSPISLNWCNLLQLKADGDRTSPSYYRLLMWSTQWNPSGLFCQKKSIQDLVILLMVSPKFAKSICLP